MYLADNQLHLHGEIIGIFLFSNPALDYYHFEFFCT